MAGNTAPVDDHALSSELEALLSVEPSGGFNARVLAAASARPRRRLSWVLAPAGALAVAALVIALISHLRSPGPASQTPAGRPFVSPVAGVPRIPAEPVIEADPPTASRRRSARDFGARAPRQRREPGVLVALDESRALGRLLARAQPLQVASVADERPLPLPSGVQVPVGPLHVPQLAIEPLSSPEDTPEGVRP